MQPRRQVIRDASRTRFRSFAPALAAAAFAFGMAAPAWAQNGEEDDPPKRTRVTLGPQIYPSYPGSDDFDVGPLLSFDRARGEEPFEFEAPDESFGFALVKTGRFSFGPAASWEGKRTAKHVGADLPTVKFSIETGGFVSFNLGENFRLRGEMRKGLTGHKGLIGIASADFVARDGDDWLFSVGPRLTWSNSRYQDAWFGVTPEASATSGLPAYDAGSGIQAYGAAASYLTKLGPRWGLYSYAKYDRLVGDAADSPIVRTLGSRDQLSGGAGLTYTFGRGGG